MQQGTAFLILIATGACITSFIMGWYPAAIVMGPKEATGTHIIWESSVSRMARATIAYYGNAASEASSTFEPTREIKKEARTQSIETLIGHSLIRDAVRAAGVEGEVQAALSEKMDGYAARPEFVSAVGLVYGLDSSGFLEFIARPETEREILMKKTDQDETAFATWLAKRKSEARIVRFWP